MSKLDDLIFNNSINDELDDKYNGKVKITVEENGRKKNTYIYNLNLDKDELKKHISAINKKKGCSGTIQKIPDNKNETRLLFQGDHREFIKQYLIDNCDIDEDSIIF